MDEKHPCKFGTSNPFKPFYDINNLKEVAGLYWHKRIDLSKSYMEKELKMSAKDTNGLLADISHGKASSISAQGLPAGVAAIIQNNQR